MKFFKICLILTFLVIALSNSLLRTKKGNDLPRKGGEVEAANKAYEECIRELEEEKRKYEKLNEDMKKKITGQKLRQMHKLRERRHILELSKNDLLLRRTLARDLRK